MDNYEELCLRIKRVPAHLTSVINSKDIGNKKTLFFVNPDYEDLIEQLSIHSKIRIEDKLNSQIISEMHKNVEFRNFMCVNIQFMLNDMNKKQTYDEFLEEYDIGLKKVNLILIKAFGFLNANNQINISKYGLEEDEAKYYKELCDNYKKTLSYLYPRNTIIDFNKHIREPFKKYLSFMGAPKLIESDELVYFNGVTTKELQNAFSCMQLHTFFEDYINALFDEKWQLVRHPIILINPITKKLWGPQNKPPKEILEGYVELDGTFLLNGSQIIFLECKNSAKVTLEYVTEFVGKVHLIERIYGINSRKILFSTGSKLKIWSGLDKYPDLKDIEIYGNIEFIDNYKNLQR